MRSTSAVLALVLIVGCAHHAEITPLADGSDTSRQVAIARSLMDLLVRGDYPEAEALFTDKLRNNLPSDMLHNFWSETLHSSGAFEMIKETRVLPARAGWSVLFTCSFERGSRTFFVGIDPQGRVNSLYNNAVLPIGRAYVRRMSRHEYDSAASLSDSKMLEDAPAAKLAKVWSSLEGEHGAFYQITSVTYEQGDAKVVASFANHTVTFTVCVNALGRVCGFHVVKTADRSGLDPTEPQLDFERQAAP